jgi:DNA-binding response OmpR family regulator
MDTSARAKIVVIDDDEVFTRILHLGLKKNGYDVYDINSAEDAIEFVNQANNVDLFILDFDLDDVSEDGLSLCRKIKAYTGKPIIMLTGESSTDVTVSCLYAGADQYVTKPYNLQELVARIHVVLNRFPRESVETTSSPELSYNGITLNGKLRELRGEQESARLTEREIQLAEVLFMNPDEDIPRDRIFALIFGKQMPPFNRAIDIIVGRLRKKLSKVTDDVIIQPSRSSGYRLTCLREDSRSIEGA